MKVALGKSWVLLLFCNEKIEVSDNNMVIKHDGKGQEDITLKRQQLCSHKDIMKG
jgi:hypothetical protein